MNRRTVLRLASLFVPSASVAGCRTRLKRFDPQPKRGLLEDRWPGYSFDTLAARYSLRLQSPDPSLTRASQTTVPTLSSDGRELGSGIGLPTVRPTRALVNLDYDANSSAGCEVAVTVFWPIDGPTPINGSRETDETMTAYLGFDNVRRFIEGTGRFRCDDDHHFYGPLNGETKQRKSEFDVTVRFQIAGESPDSRFAGDIQYRNAVVLYRIAELAVPGIG